MSKLKTLTSLLVLNQFTSKSKVCCYFQCPKCRQNPPLKLWLILRGYDWLKAVFLKCAKFGFGHFPISILAKIWLSKLSKFRQIISSTFDAIVFYLLRLNGILLFQRMKQSSCCLWDFWFFHIPMPLISDLCPSNTTHEWRGTGNWTMIN